MSKFGAFISGLAIIATLLNAARLTNAEDTQPELAKWIDQRFERHFRELDVKPAEAVDDATFLRRVYLDLAGRIPSIALRVDS